MILKKKLKAILLVDDDESTNYFHKLMIKKADISENVYVAYNGKEALDFLKKSAADKKSDNTQPEPDLILLDINMPKVNGWDFLEEYKKLKEELKDQIIIVMLTTSFNPDDEKKAKTIKEVSAYNYKPLTDEMLGEILKNHFPGNVE